MTLPVVILAGGLGKRLGQKTLKKAKCLVDIGGKPFISRQLNYLGQQGIKEVILCIGHFGQQIKEIVGDGSRYNLRVIYSNDGDQLLGTGGSIKKACNILKDNFFILYGDTFLPIDFSKVEKTFFYENKPAMMTVLKNQGQWDKSNAYFNNNLVRYSKKSHQKSMNYIDYGLNVVKKSVFNEYPANANFDLSAVFEKLSAQSLLAGLEIYDRFYEIGSVKGLNETIEFFKKNEQKYIL